MLALVGPSVLFIALFFVAPLGLFFFAGASGRSALAFFVILGLSAFAMFRVWRDEHTYG